MAKRKPIIPRQERGTYRKGDHTVANPTNRTNQTNHIATGRLQNFTRVGLLVVLLGILAVLTLLLRLRMPPINTNPDPSLVALQPWFAGETITVPQQAGLWLQSSAHGVWLAKLARSMGRAQVIDLCTQRKQLAHDPMAIFEIRLAGGWQTMQQSTLPPSQWHQALILPNYASAGAPLLRIAGRAGNTEAETNLTMELAGPNPNWRLLTDKGLLGAADGAQFAFTGQAWLLWRKPDSRTPPEHFDYALHLVKRTGSGHPQPASTTCRAGSIEARFWQAADMAPGAVELEIWHQRSGWHSARLASGRHTIGDNRLEDQQLFDAAQQQGLIRLNQQGKVELAPSDLLLARRAGVAVPEWAQIDSNNEAVVRLHKRLYTRRDGEFVRAEIGRANASQLRRAACLLQPTLQRQACLQVEQDTFRHIHIRGKQLVWHSAPQAAQTGPLATVTIRARDGTVLYADGKVSERASALGLAPLFSTADGPGLGQSLAGSVGLAGARQADARLSIDPTWQALARQILHCDGALGGQWQIGSAQCAAPKPVPNAGSNENSNDMTDDAPAIPGRRTAMVVIDANSGDILVATGSKIQANWQHDGGLENNPGSSFKLVSALGLEWAAQSHPWIEPLLAGAPAPQIDAIARQQGSAFAMNESCYPAPCQGRATDISNFKQHLPQHYSNAAGQFGVAEALSGSLNTWFTWLAEASDATLAKRQPDLLPLTPNALDEARPIMHMAHTLGFEQSLLLDGGLLAPSLSGQAAHILRTSPSQFDPIQDRSQIRWHAIGSRMQVTPLQMALVAAAIGNGHTTTARLLTQLNQQPASNPPAQALGVRLDRIRAGMKAVVEQGTAKTAFAHLPAERRGIYGKTGTVPRGQGAARRQNMSWFVGYIEPGTIEGEQRRLAFAVMISRTEETGGTGAARVVADWVAAVGK